MLVYIMSYENSLSDDIIITNPEVIEPHYDFVDIDIIYEEEPNEIKKEITNIWKPLEFWFNKKTGLSLPVIAIPEYINVSFDYTIPIYSDFILPNYLRLREP